MNAYAGFSILHGETKNLLEKDDCATIHRIFEERLKVASEEKQSSASVAIQGVKQLSEEPVIYYEKTVTPLSLVNEEANQLARAILEGFKPSINLDGDIIIAVHMAPNCSLIFVLLAILKLNGSFLPLDSQWPDHRIQYLLKEAQASLVITDESNDKRFQGCAVTTFRELYETTLDTSNANLTEEECWDIKTPETERIAIILYTSGTTAVPKGARLSHLNVLNRLKWQWKKYPYSATERVGVFKTSLTFVDSIAEMWGPLLTNRSLAVLSKRQVVDPEQLIKACNTYKIERLVVTPSLLHNLLPYIRMANQRKKIEGSEEIRNVSDLKFCVSSAEVLPVDLAKTFYENFSEDKTTLLNFYGSTEVTGDVLYHPVPGKDVLTQLDHIPLGKPVDNTTIYILDNLFQPVKIGEIGELFCSGLSVASGYVRNASNKFIDNPFTNDPNHSKLFRLGDLGRMESGMIYFEGRGDSQIKIRGHRVNVMEVEAALSNIKSVDRFMVLCYKSGKADQALLAFVVPKDPGLEAKNVEEELTVTLTQYMMPKVVIIESIPLLTSKKVDRQRLFSMYENQFKVASIDDTDFDFTGISRELHDKAKILFQVVTLTLGPSLSGKIDASSNYYQLGGNSLNSVAIVTKLYDAGYIITVGDFINANTLLDVMYAMQKEDVADSASLSGLGSISPNEFTTELIQPCHKKDIFTIITESYSKKGTLENLSALKIRKEHYEEVLESLWESLITEKITFVVKNREGEILAVAINRDGECAAGLENVNPKNNWMRIVDFFGQMEKQVSEGSLPKGKVFTNVAAGTAQSASPQDNVKLFLIIEHEIIRLARERGYIGVYTNNINTLTLQLGQDIFKYQVLMEFQVNKYITPDGIELFSKADDSVKAQLIWLDL